jgi:mono/diheme cytochrome c family protein
MQGRAALLTIASAVPLLAGLIAAAVPTAAQETTAPATTTTTTQETTAQTSSAGGKTVWDGVYAVEQAARGREVYDKICAECHSTGEAPNLLGNAFLRRWFEETLDVPFTKMRTSMPDDAPGSLAIDMYVDVLSYMLEAGGLPPGKESLPSDVDRLSAIKVVTRPDSGGTVPNFSLVQVVGCLAQDADGAWSLTDGTTPVRTREPGNSPADVHALASSALGAETFNLLAVLQEHRNLKGHKVQAKGLLMRNPKGDSLNLTAMQSVSETCAK